VLDGADEAVVGCLALKITPVQRVHLDKYGCIRDHQRSAGAVCP